MFKTGCHFQSVHLSVYVRAIHLKLTRSLSADSLHLEDLSVGEDYLPC